MSRKTWVTISSRRVFGCLTALTRVSTLQYVYNPSGQNDVVATLFRRRSLRRYNVEIMVTMKVVSTSFVNILPTSSNDVVSTLYFDVETTSKTRWLWKLYRRHLSIVYMGHSHDNGHSRDNGHSPYNGHSCVNGHIPDNVISNYLKKIHTLISN